LPYLKLIDLFYPPGPLIDPPDVLCGAGSDVIAAGVF
jgi:hypothetical protein